MSIANPKNVVVIVLFLMLAGCNGCPDVAARFADADGDGWFDGNLNRATVLTLTTISFSHSSQGRYRVLVDGVRFPSGPTIPIDDLNADNWLAVAPIDTATMNVGVATRIQARNKYNGSLDPGRSRYTTTVQVQQLTGSGITDFGTVSLNYSSDGGETLTPTFGGGAFASITVTLTTATTDFPDPNPGSATADSDGDGIVESDEAVLVSSFGGIGDPRPGMRDLVLVVGFTEPQLNIDPFTVELMKTRFFTRAINLHVDNGTLNGQAGIGGLMNLGGVPVVPGTAISLAQATLIRNALPPTRRFAHVAVLAASIPTGFGIASGIPGSELVMNSQMEPLSPNFLGYQSGVLMHELGHLLALCHPTLHDGASCAAIPTAERDPGATAMGSPAETPGLIGAPATIVNALRRPIDYTPAQWGLVRVGAGLRP